MYANVWAKYLPIIRIVLKRSLSAEQILSLNASDFQKAGLSRKAGYKFQLQYRDGKIDHVIVDLPLASSLSTALLGDPKVKELFAENDFNISLNPKFELTIRHIQQYAATSPLAEAATI